MCSPASLQSRKAACTNSSHGSGSGEPKHLLPHKLPDPLGIIAGRCPGRKPGRCTLIACLTPVWPVPSTRSRSIGVHRARTPACCFTATEDNVVQAFDATTSKELWRRAVGCPVRRSSLPCGNINPLGITGTPVIDPATQAIYFDAAVERPNGPRHEVFGLSLKDGSVLPGWPVDVAETLQRAGRHFDPRIQNSALGTYAV